MAPFAIMKCTHFIVFLFGIFLPSISSRHVQFYRKDYTYIEEFDAFYKVHWDLKGMSWNLAFLLCEDEGATLFQPKFRREWALVKNLTDNISEEPSVTKIFVGLNDDFISEKYSAIDSQSNPYYSIIGEEFGVPDVNGNYCVYMYMYTGSFSATPCLEMPDSPLPFLCKRLDNKSCPTADRDYKYSKDLRKCFKINKKPNTWLQAMMSCSMEGGMLAVVENMFEANVIRDIMAEPGKTYFVGVRKMFSQNDYYTVKGQIFDQSIRFLPADPNSDPDSPQECGALYFLENSLCTTTADCDITLPFICEMEVTV